MLASILATAGYFAVPTYRFVLATGWRLLGQNGAGKSTLMKLLAGQGEMDEGTLWMSPGAEIAYLPQSPTNSAGHEPSRACHRRHGRCQNRS
jgi:ATPase subunit of ABC transporter with duplicated ATPase domains